VALAQHIEIFPTSGDERVLFLSVSGVGLHIIKC